MISGLRRRIPPGIAAMLFFIGPGLILAIEASGESGITELIAAGYEHGFALFWVIAAALIFKFAFTNGIARYTVATGTSIFDDGGVWRHCSLCRQHAWKSHSGSGTCSVCLCPAHLYPACALEGFL
jgi:hypothetical protein